jgi:RNA polymerase sigma-70 factor (ECF subfamily)
MDRTGQLIDAGLVIEAQAGSATALDALVQRWQRRMYAYARRLLGQDDKAWDACQEAWIGIVRGLQKLDDPSAFAAWAYRIVTNKCKDRLTQEARDRWLNQEFAANSAAGQPAKESTELREAIGLLPGPMQAVLTLRYFEGFALSEIGQILGVPEGTIKSRLNRARVELKRILEK